MRGDGRIYQRGEIFFIAYSVNGREFRESTRSREWGDAQALLERRLRDRETVERAVVAAPNGPTFDEIATAYLDEYRLREFRSLPAVETRVIHLTKFFGGMPASGITVSIVTRYQSARRLAGSAAGSVNRETASLHRIL